MFCEMLFWAQIPLSDGRLTGKEAERVGALDRDFNQGRPH